MIKISVQADISGALRKLQLTKEEASKAIPRALNKTATTARAEAAREIKAAGYKLKIGDLKKSITIKRASRAVLTAQVTASGKPIPLSRYGARQNRKGVSVAVLKGRKTITGAFLATMPSGHRGVFVRQGKGRLPIDQKFGPSVPDAFSNKVVQGALRRVIRERFNVVLAQELRFARLRK